MKKPVYNFELHTRGKQELLDKVISRKQNTFKHVLLVKPGDKVWHIEYQIEDMDDPIIFYPTTREEFEEQLKTVFRVLPKIKWGD